MSSHLRHSNECQNCGYTVDVAYCSKCGMKNTETRQPFHHLLAHFVEDFTHYDAAFLKTIMHLLFRPGRLTIEYLQGYRQRYVPPVKLYIFISFVTFFLMGVLHYREEKDEGNVVAGTPGRIEIIPEKAGTVEIDGHEFSTVEEMDKYRETAPADKKPGMIEFWMERASLNMQKSKHPEAIQETFMHTLPKVLFIYMPVFAFWLWLLHGKKRWYFFDHGIFTLHYFSFMLLFIAINKVILWLLGYINETLFSISRVVLSALFFVYTVFYFFRAHRRMYGEKKWISRLKGISLFVINFILISVVMFLTLFYVLNNI